jgi:hypothetical protein
MSDQAETEAPNAQSGNNVRVVIACILFIIDCLIVFQIVAQQKRIEHVRQQFKASVTEINRLRSGKQ